MVPMRRMAMLVTVALAMMMALGTGVAPAASAQASPFPQAPITDPLSPATILAGLWRPSRGVLTFALELETAG